MPVPHMRKTVPFAEAETLGLTALAFLAEERQRLARFLGATGMSADALAAAAAAPATLAAVLEHLLGDESLLMVFAATRHLDAARIAPAARVLTDAVAADRPA